jgi:hypothetical protein
MEAGLWIRYACNCGRKLIILASRVGFLQFQVFGDRVNEHALATRDRTTLIRSRGSILDEVAES